MLEEKKQITWTAPEFVHYPKSLTWFVIIAIVGLVLVGYFLFQRDYLTATLFILLLAIVFYFGKAKPKHIKIQLDSQGLKLGDTRVPYSQIKKFWIVYDPPTVKILNFETQAYLNRFITLQLENENPVEVRHYLLEYLPEDLEKGEQLSDKISRGLRF